VTVIIQQSFDHSKSDHLKSCDAILTNVKETDFLVEICFICHKSDHNFKECLNQPTKINAVNNKYNHFNFNFNSNFDSKN